MSLLSAIELKKPKRWDLAGVIILVATLAVVGANLAVSQSSTATGSISGGVTTVFATLSLVLCLLSFMVLGKTAEMGTIWGTMLSLAASIVGMTGVLLATALWAIS